MSSKGIVLWDLIVGSLRQSHFLIVSSDIRKRRQRAGIPVGLRIVMNARHLRRREKLDRG